MGFLFPVPLQLFKKNLFMVCCGMLQLAGMLSSCLIVIRTLKVLNYCNGVNIESLDEVSVATLKKVHYK